MKKLADDGAAENTHPEDDVLMEFAPAYQVPAGDALFPLILT